MDRQGRPNPANDAYATTSGLGRRKPARQGHLLVDIWTSGGSSTRSKTDRESDLNGIQSRAVAWVSGFEAGATPRCEALERWIWVAGMRSGLPSEVTGPGRKRSGLRAVDGVVLNVGCFSRLTEGGAHHRVD